MSGSDFIVNVTEADFEFQVLAYSQNIPVIVDFWAEWCAPCRVLAPTLEKLAQEANGSFRLAKVDVDESPNLSRRYQIRSIPNVKAFKDGRVVSEFMGAQPEGRVREFLKSIVPDENALMLEKGLMLLRSKRFQDAEDQFRTILTISPENPPALLGLSRSLLFNGLGEESIKILGHFPASREYASAEKLRPLAEALVNDDPDGIFEDDILEAAFQTSLRLIKRGNIEAAMDGLLDILKQNKRFKDGKAQRIMLSLFELLGEDDPVTHQYRQELASVLF